MLPDHRVMRCKGGTSVLSAPPGDFSCSRLVLAAQSAIISNRREKEAGRRLGLASGDPPTCIATVESTANFCWVSPEVRLLCPQFRIVETTIGLTAQEIHLIAEITIREKSRLIAREIEAFLAERSGYQPGEIDQRIRQLRHSLIPSGPRGLNAPHLEPLHVAICLLAMVSRRATDAAKVAMRAMELKSVPRPGIGIAELALALAPALAAGVIRGSDMIRRVEITCDGTMAWVTLADGGTLFFCDDKKLTKAIEKDPSKYEAAGSHYCGHRFVLTGAIFDQLRAEMSEGRVPAKYAERRT